MLAERDVLLEDIYTLIHRTGNEHDATDAARIGKLAIEYRLNQLKRQRMQKAIDKRAAERRALRASTTGERGQCEHTSDGAAVCLQAAPAEGNEQ